MGSIIYFFRLEIDKKGDNCIFYLFVTSPRDAPQHSSSVNEGFALSQDTTQVTRKLCLLR